jgi:flagellar biosynthesis protein
MPEDKSKRPRKAVALRYQMDRDEAPRLVAKGERLVAGRILEIARENDIHIQEDPELVALLSKLDVQAEVPPELYQAVAEVLSFVYRLNQRLNPIPKDQRP